VGQKILSKAVTQKGLFANTDDGDYDYGKNRCACFPHLAHRLDINNGMGLV
jgi:hypothetical protein